MILFNLLVTALITAVLGALFLALLAWARTLIRTSESSLRRVSATARLASFARSRKALPIIPHYDS